jgi:hypothetical protein
MHLKKKRSEKEGNREKTKNGVMIFAGLVKWGFDRRGNSETNRCQW